MTQTLPPPEKEAAESADEQAAPKPGRLRLRRKLLLWSIPLVLLLLLFAIKLASVGILGNKLPAQFVAEDQAGMNSTLGWLDVGSIGRGYRERLAAGDLDMLARDLNAALVEFKAAHDDEPSACPPMANFALTAETLSDGELKAGNFIKARELLEPAVQAANGDKGCFATSTVPVREARDFVSQTPDRISNKLAALKNGNITASGDGYGYLTSPGGGVMPLPVPGGPAPCPFDDARLLRECVQKRDADRQQKIDAAQKQAEAGAQPPPDPNQPPPPPPPPAAPPPAASPQSANDAPQFPGPPGTTGDFCKGNGTPLDDLGAALCAYSGPLP